MRKPPVKTPKEPFSYQPALKAYGCALKTTPLAAVIYSSRIGSPTVTLQLAANGEDDPLCATIREAMTAQGFSGGYTNPCNAAVILGLDYANAKLKALQKKGWVSMGFDIPCPSHMPHRSDRWDIEKDRTEKVEPVLSAIPELSFNPQALQPSTARGPGARTR